MRQLSSHFEHILFYFSIKKPQCIILYTKIQVTNGEKYLDSFLTKREIRFIGCLTELTWGFF